VPANDDAAIPGVSNVAAGEAVFTASTVVDGELSPGACPNPAGGTGGGAFSAPAFGVAAVAGVSFSGADWMPTRRVHRLLRVRFLRLCSGGGSPRPTAGVPRKLSVRRRLRWLRRLLLLLSRLVNCWRHGIVLWPRLSLQRSSPSHLCTSNGDIGLRSAVVVLGARRARR
jgi:hypothetical protein